MLLSLSQRQPEGGGEREIQRPRKVKETVNYGGVFNFHYNRFVSSELSEKPCVCDFLPIKHMMINNESK